MTGSPLLKKLLLIEDDTVNLLPSVREAVRRQQDQSERLIGWVQLALVLIFGVLYLVAPKTHMDTILHSPVPFALILYLIFTMIRLLLSYRISLPDWYLGLSGAVDIALLMTLIWSFHIQYGQTAPFYLKAPTMLYVFIFIALRALRYEPHYVLRTGLAAAFGWAVLLIYALMGHDGGSPITRDYVAYLTSNKVLLGGELDKILSILVVTGLLTLAQSRSRKTLIKAIAETHTTAELSRFFAPEIAEKIARGETGRGEAMDACVMYIDIRDFTALSERITPSELVSLLTDYQTRMVPVIGAHGGTVERFAGDGVMATFGAIIKSPDYAKSALDATQAILDAGDAWCEERVSAGLDPVRIGVAVTSGSLIVCAIGGGGRYEYTVIGEPANRAAKIEKLNKIMGVRAIADGATLALARDQGWSGTIVKEHKAIAVEGVDTPVDLVVLG